MRTYIVIAAFFSFFANSQNNYPQDFGLPLEIGVELTSTFGELRTNHFHAGVDFKTQEREGYKVLSVGDGYVSRIKISRYGYGKALYVTHPNGYTTVYGHLKEFSDKIEAYVKSEQKRQKKFEIELFPKASELSVVKAEEIGKSGDTGGSGGPHLHFEYRDTKTEKIINPFLFGLDQKVKDLKSPKILQLKAYPLDESIVNESNTKVSIVLKEKGDGGYITDPVYVKGKVGFGIEYYDLSNTNWNKKGIYRIKTINNGAVSYEFLNDSFSFDESRYINASIDYEHYITDKKRIQKLFVDNANKLSTIKVDNDKGAIVVQPNLNYLYRIIVEDYHGNNTEIVVPIVYKEQTVPATSETATGYFINSKIDNSLAKEGVSVFMPANCFYSDFNFDFAVQNGIASIHRNTVPVHRNISIAFSIGDIKPEERKGLFIASYEDGKWEYNTSKISGDVISVNVKLLGDFKLEWDNDPPLISGLSFEKKEVLDNNAKIKLKIKDELSGIDSYDAYIDGQWFLMEYEMKEDKLFGTLKDINLVKGKHEFKVVVTDKLGNKAELINYFVTK